MKINKLTLFILFANICFAQQVVTAKLEPVAKSGLHQILIPSQIRSFSNDDMSDFRIFDSKNVEVPYSIIKINFDAVHYDYKPFKIISKVQIPNKNTTIIFENAVPVLDQIVLKISNSEIKKPYAILGSNDMKNWFGLTENQLFEDYKESIALPVPNTKFQYIKIELNDKKSLPINVEEVGFSEIIPQKYPTEKIIARRVTITENKEEKKTIIKVSFIRKQLINKINFEGLKNPIERYGLIYKYENQTIKHKIVFQKVILHDFDGLKISNTNNVGFFEKEFYIEIENQDNPPISFSKIDFIQNNENVIAELNENEQYTISAGNSKFEMPKYYMPHFTDKYRLPNDFPKAKIANISIANPLTPKVRSKSFYQNPWFMWLCIGLGGLSILYFTTRLVKDMKQP